MGGKGSGCEGQFLICGQISQAGGHWGKSAGAKLSPEGRGQEHIKTMMEVKVMIHSSPQAGEKKIYFPKLY